MFIDFSIFVNKYLDSENEIIMREFVATIINGINQSKINKYRFDFANFYRLKFQALEAFQIYNKKEISEQME